MEGLEEQRGLRMVVDEKKETWDMRGSREEATCMDATSRVQAWSGASSSPRVDNACGTVSAAGRRRFCRRVVDWAYAAGPFSSCP